MSRQSLAPAVEASVRPRRPSVIARLVDQRALRRRRRVADAELLRSAFPSAETAWRASEWGAPKTRRGIARAVRRTVKASDARSLPGATPLNRIAVREQAQRLLALADRVENPSVPVRARGLLLLDRLLRDAYGPLYVSYRAVELRDTLTRIERELEGTR